MLHCRDKTVGESLDGASAKQFWSFEFEFSRGFNGFPPLSGIGMSVPAESGSAQGTEFRW